MITKKFIKKTLNFYRFIVNIFVKLATYKILTQNKFKNA